MSRQACRERTEAWRARRRLLLAGAVLVAAHARWPSLARAGSAVRFGLTPVFLDDQITFLRDWQKYLEERLRTPVQFVQRGSYREITELLLADKLDFAWLCGFPYVRNRARMQLVAVPRYGDGPLYQSYLIVPASDRRTAGIADLRGRIYAYSDPNSNSGWLVPQVLLHELGVDAASYFKKTFFTWSHRKVVEAVASGLADAGSVDGYVWDTLQQLHPELTARTRIAHRSKSFGFPPIVARASLADSESVRLRAVLAGMTGDERGRVLLRTLNLSGFEGGQPSLFDGIAANLRTLGLT